MQFLLNLIGISFGSWPDVLRERPQPPSIYVSRADKLCCSACLLLLHLVVLPRNRTLVVYYSCSTKGKRDTKITLGI